MTDRDIYLENHDRQFDVELQAGRKEIIYMTDRDIYQRQAFNIEFERNITENTDQYMTDGRWGMEERTEKE